MASKLSACHWRYDATHDKWDTECEQAHIFIAEGPKENDYKFCPYCGAQVRVFAAAKGKKARNGNAK